MTSEGVAYKSSDAQVLADFATYKARAEEAHAARKAMEDRFGRRLMIRRGWGHAVDVVGFEQLDTDADGDVLGDNGELRVPKTGPPYSTVVPNIRRKAGKDLAAELRAMRLEGPDLSGMPAFAMIGLHMLSPALFEHDGAIWARWSDEPGNVDTALWERVPLSAYFAAKEARESAEVDA